MTEPVDLELNLDRIKTAPRSVSQLKNYKDCGHRYYLERVERVWQRPAAWFPQGTAVHRAAEVYELTGRRLTVAEAQAVFETAYTAEVNDYLAVTPRTDFWFASGPYGGEEDIPRRFEIGREQVAKYLEYFGVSGKAADIRVWVAPDGTPGIEMEFDVDLDGVRVRGKIDTVMVKINRDGKTEIIVVDNKTGLKPGDDFQLAVYAVALHELYGIVVKTGYYWMAKTTGHLTRPYDLSAWTREAVSAEFAAMDAAVRAERFEPTTDPKNCERCSVSTSCRFFGKIPLA